MAISLTHTTVAVGTDAGNGEIRKAQWNENHTLTMATARLLGRTTAGTGAAEEISVGAGLTLAAGVLSGGGLDILGTISTASGASASLGSLDLTSYKMLVLMCIGVGHSSSSALFVGNSTSDDVSVSLSTTSYNGIVLIDLADGVGVSIVGSGSGAFPQNFDTALSTASTAVSVAPGSGNFNAGSIRVIGLR